MKRKWWVLAKPPYSRQGNGRQSLRVELFNKEDRQPDGGEPREPVSSKVVRTSKTAGAFQIHSRKTIMTTAEAP